MPVQCPYYEDVFSKIEKDRGAHSVEQVMKAQLGDWSAEEPFWLGVLALLNSKNASEIVPGPDLDKLNKARRKRGQADLLTFSTCRIAPKIRDRIRGESGQSGESTGVRAHFVRGHFKVRPSGVFWWSPFLRGDKRLGFADKDYRVVGEKA